MYYSTEIISYVLVNLDLPYIFYLFQIMRHSPGIFQYNQNISPSLNQIPEVYIAILIVEHLIWPNLGSINK